MATQTEKGLAFKILSSINGDKVTQDTIEQADPNSKRELVRKSIVVIDEVLNLGMDGSVEWLQVNRFYSNAKLYMLSLCRN